ncbi:response regulator [Marivita hallyeonensis]|uniref:Response regulator receiver domain-containing protein n=1 Tax=Marivita hallyeonensis TaxID=996342 RepID=A0A1M5MQL7_9RHOB|nr:response regulator [Marivita hallyeonensis]SHG79497.1 Response regulator receiver domain-containing protein [Marivita hallyeonensis]
MKILAVDDDAIALELLEVSLIHAGYDDIDLARSAAEAMTLIDAADTTYDCMLFDIVMPNTGGIELCQQVREIPRYCNVPIIMITAVKSEEVLKDAILAGATDYVHKPYDGLELGARLRAASMLSEAAQTLGRSYALQHATDDTSEPSGLRLSDAVTLETKPGIVTQIALWDQMAKSGPLPEGVHVFATAIVGGSAIFNSVSNAIFRSFLNEFAVVLAQTTHVWTPQISYLGDGVFGVALLKADPADIEKIQSKLKSTLGAKPFESLTDYTGKLSAYFEHVLHADASDKTHENAVCTLIQAGKAARDMAFNHSPVERQRDLRMQFLGDGKTGPLKSWEVPLVHQVQKVKPRRVKRRTSERQDRT